MTTHGYIYLDGIRLNKDVELPYQLPNGLWLEGFPHKDIKEKLGIGSLYERYPMRLSRCHCRLRWSKEEPSSSPRVWEESLDQAAGFVTALRLRSLGEVGILSGLVLDSAEVFWRADFQLPRFIQNPYGYALDHSKLQKALLLQESLLKQAGDKHLVVGLRRFNQSYSRQSPEDRIVDLCVALEATLLAGVRQELTYKLALRGAALTAGQFRGHSAADVFALYQATYHLRSSIVHDGTTLQTLPKELGKGLKKVLLQESWNNSEDFFRIINDQSRAWKREELAPRVLPADATIQELVRTTLRTYLKQMTDCGRSIEQVNSCLQKLLLDLIENGLPTTTPMKTTRNPRDSSTA